MPGRFHELSLSTPDISASIEFYERLGFWQAPTGDAWRHRYGVVTDGRVALGLHETEDFAALTFIDPELQTLAESLSAAGIELTMRQTDPEVFNQIEFADPAGQRVRVVAARTFSPADRAAERHSLLGYFAHYSMPVRAAAAAAAFWEPLGFVAMPQEEAPYAHQGLTSDGIDLALHALRLLPAPALVFCEERMGERISRLRESGVAFDASLPPALAHPGNALLEAPEGTLLLLLTGTL
jgi:catechol 2,3-dioxygenase-like lactoylglutathione lyase family enzyme